VPTADEFGFKGFEALTWWGCFGPTGVPKEVSERFGNALADTLRDPPVNRQLSETLQIKFDIGGGDRLRSFLATQMRTWGAVVRENNIKGE
jgi:tripartite-type tricarboxylate transporter receptor subunit TctC